MGLPTVFSRSAVSEEAVGVLMTLMTTGRWAQARQRVSGGVKGEGESAASLDARNRRL